MSHHVSSPFFASVDPGLDVVPRGVGVVVTSQHVVLDVLRSSVCVIPGVITS